MAKGGCFPAAQPNIVNGLQALQTAGVNAVDSDTEQPDADASLAEMAAFKRK